MGEEYEIRQNAGECTAYFEDLISDIETYQSNSGGTTKQEQYESITNVKY